MAVWGGVEGASAHVGGAASWVLGECWCWSYCFSSASSASSVFVYIIKGSSSSSSNTAHGLSLYI